MALEELYREVILDHYTHPRNRGRLEPADIAAEGANPLCGDELVLTVRLDQERVADVRFEGRGCSISQASASMMTEQVKGRPIAEVRALIERVKAMLRGEAGAEGAGDLAALQGVRRFPVRVKCATLPWITLEQALDDHAAGRLPARATTE